MVHHRKDIANLPAYHARDHAWFGPLARGIGAYSLSVTQDRNAITNPKHLIQLMRDIDHPDASSPQFIENPKQCLDLAVGEGGGRLVKHEDPGIVRERLRYFHQLLLANAKIANRYVNVNRQVQIVKQLARAPI